MLGRLQLLRSWRSRAQRITGKRKRCEQRQKRGKHDGVLERLKANARRPPIPSLFLANVRSLDNKLDLLRIRMSVSEEMRNCSILCLTETWLRDNMPNSAFQIYGWQLFRADRNMLSGKARRGGLCIYINKGWCMNGVVINSHYSEDVELMTVKCRPVYSPRQFLVMFVIAPHANANNALKELHNNMSSLQNKQLKAFYVVAGDFNHVNPDRHLAKVSPPCHHTDTGK
ncbi:KRAB domain-containing zinc finger protein [Sarotherodon galilaeus]